MTDEINHETRYENHFDLTDRRRNGPNASGV